MLPRSLRRLFGKTDDPARTGPVRPVEPEPENSALIIESLWNELTLASENVSGIERKAVLIPAFLVALASLVIGEPGTRYSELGYGLLVVAAALGGISTYLVLRTVNPGDANLGPKADIISEAQYQEPPLLRYLVAKSLETAVEETATQSVDKSDRYVRAVHFAAACMIVLLLVRVFGAVPLSSESPATPAESSPSPSASVGASAMPTHSQLQSNRPSVTPTSKPSKAVPTRPNTSPTPLKTTGSQYMSRGGEVSVSVKARIKSTGG